MRKIMLAMALASLAACGGGQTAEEESGMMDEAAMSEESGMMADTAESGMMADTTHMMGDSM